MYEKKCIVNTIKIYYENRNKKNKRNYIKMLLEYKHKTDIFHSKIKIKKPNIFKSVYE